MNALDLSNFEVAGNLVQSLYCVIVIVGFNGTGSGGVSGDIIIESNNGNNNTNSGNDPVTGPDTDSQAPEV